MMRHVFRSLQGVFASTLLTLLPTVVGCAAEAPAHKRIVGTWQHTGDLYRSIITYHSDGTWAMTCQVMPPPPASQPDDASNGLFDGLIRAVAGGTSRNCSGTWRIIDGRLVTTVTGSAMEEVPVGLAYSEELIVTDDGSLKLRQQEGDVQVWTRDGHSLGSQ